METVYEPDPSDISEKRTGLHAVDSNMVAISKRQSMYPAPSKSLSLNISAVISQ